MATIEVLNNIEHKDLKIRPIESHGEGLSVNRSLVYVSEVANLHKEFPLVIHKDEDENDLQLHAILGFEKDENLFVDENGWISKHAPALLKRGPFSLGYANTEDTNNTASQENPLICIDVDDPRVSAEQGEAIFLPFGGEAPLLQDIKSSLQLIQMGMKYNATLFAMINEFDLLEPLSIQIKLNSEEEINLQGYYTIRQDTLTSLSGEALEKLNKFGVLSVLFYLLSSLSNFQHMIDIKNQVIPSEH
ncbi:SapC family protein [Glaciecola sp. KUL10]|uniref:SapC family protein n=1 Tax=Glaciecola sp. (strain KUL10) TaxID=2161813 RepID=UPI000D787930|nr:SapC family protein [Glaciecola sp. KUL10]GBL04352.1 hypothetical protein KUL10_16580 [Glaciecola sp. KUL10]